MGINFQELTFKYQKKQTNNTINTLDLSINSQDEFVAILGHTGSGKSTMVQLMNALLLPTTGRAFINNQELTHKGLKNKKLKLKTIRHHVGLVFQFPEYQLFEDTVLKDIMFGPINFGKTPKDAEEISKGVCDDLNIPSDILTKSPFSLSGGWMRKVAIAGILACDPEILVLDEPTVGLDPKGKIELMELLNNISKKTHKSIIMISHDMNIVAKYAKRVIVMKEGTKVYDGEKRALFEDSNKLMEYNLNLPECAKIALELKNKGLISFNHLPLSIDELYNVITNEEGDVHE